MSPFINDDLISKNLGKTLVLTWTIQICEWFYVYSNFHYQQSSIVSWLFYGSNNQFSKSDFAQKKFGDRINVTWDGRTFKVELKYLQNNDTGNFSLYCFVGHVSSYPSCILITEAKGMYRFTSEFMHYDIGCFGTLEALLLLTPNMQHTQKNYLPCSGISPERIDSFSAPDLLWKF